MTPMGFFNGDEHSESRKWSEKKIDATIVRCHIATVAFTIPFFFFISFACSSSSFFTVRSPAKFKASYQWTRQHKKKEYTDKKR